MKTSRLIASKAALALFCATFSAGALAWNATGHRLVAAIAWDEMSANARDTVTKLLRQHPDYPRWIKRAGARDSESQAERRVFIEASTWPDEIRQDTRFYSAGKGEPTPLLPGFPDMERRTGWHTVGIPLNGRSDVAPISGQLNRRLPELIGALGRDKPDEASTSDLGRIYALPWVIHLAGDSHQPLHASARLRADGQWDRQGQGLDVRNPFSRRKPVSTLHVYWDDLPGPSGLRGEKLDSTAHALAAMHASVERSTDSRQWIEESWRLARDLAYPAVSPDAAEPVEIDAAFHEVSREIAGRRVAQAGFRLAAVLDAAFGASSRRAAGGKTTQR